MVFRPQRNNIDVTKALQTYIYRVSFCDPSFLPAAGETHSPVGV